MQRTDPMDFSLCKCRICVTIKVHKDSVTSGAKVKAGKITAVAKGSCYVYVYAQNGRMARVKVTVK